MSNPEVSVIFPAYNAEKYLLEAVTSILSQTFHDFELIIVDDGSTDNTKNIIEKFAGEDSRIKPLFNERNLGVVESLNRAIDASKGKYIARMDHDDIALPDRLEIQVRFLEEHSDISLVACNVILIDEKGHTIGIRRLAEKPEEIAERLVLGNQLVHPTVMLRREVFETVGKYKNILHAEDYLLWIEMVKSGLKLYNLQTPLLKYRIIDPHKVTITHKLRCGVSTINLKLMAWKSLGHRVSPLVFAFNILKEAIWLLLYVLLPSSLFFKIYTHRVLAIYSGKDD
ncbi:MAG: glycosyltransferase [Nitrospirota bacterium]